jgi:hypothetical protein
MIALVKIHTTKREEGASKTTRIMKVMLYFLSDRRSDASTGGITRRVFNCP